MAILLRNAHVLFADRSGDDLFVEDGRIQFRRARNGVQSSADGSFVLPGLVDSHAHLITSPSIGVHGLADFVAYDHNPLSDPEVLLNPRLVVRNGQVVSLRNSS